jgi:hypothetical protein
MLRNMRREHARISDQNARGDQSTMPAQPSRNPCNGLSCEAVDPQSSADPRAADQEIILIDGLLRVEHPERDGTFGNARQFAQSIIQRAAQNRFMCHMAPGRQNSDDVGRRARRYRENGSSHGQLRASRTFADKPLLGPDAPNRRFPQISIFLESRDQHLRARRDRRRSVQRSLQQRRTLTESTILHGRRMSLQADCAVRPMIIRDNDAQRDVVGSGCFTKYAHLVSLLAS